jgi:hypothetical protein
MNAVMLNAKYVIFLAMEAFVIATLVAAVITGLHQAIRATAQPKTAIPTKADTPAS